MVKKSTRRRFSAQLTTINRAIEIVMEKMEVEKWDYRRDGDGKAVLAWLLNEKEYQVLCDEFNCFDDNLRACEQAVTLVYRVYDEYKVRTSDIPADLGIFFMGFRVEAGRQILALSAPTDSPYEIMGIPHDATIGEINKRYRALAKKYHPDTGDGNAAEFNRITKAKDELIELRK